ncbi:hypothetical protein KBA63_02460 [Candidatus Woesebacteria bacterium]|nr:hypothetical protein [Candidatus Woesebacteria bacterium]
MPYKKKPFVIVQNNLPKVIDVDDSLGRSVPINMNFVESGYLAKDTGVSLFGAVDAAMRHSLFYYKKKNGTAYFLSATGTKLQRYDFGTSAWVDLSPTFTANAKFGFVVYDDNLYGSNGVEDYFKWDGTTFTTYASAPKGNILEIYEDRVFVSGVTAEPLSIYPSNVGDPTTFTPTDVIKPLGTDAVTNLKNYYGLLLIFKQNTIWKITYQYDQVVSLFIPKLELQSGNYGAASRLSVTWVENDLWFFTGREIRSIGFKDQQIGVLGVNRSVISDPIKETLYTIPSSKYGVCSVFYLNRRFYLNVPIASTATTPDTQFVCHILFSNSWTKYNGRIKSNASEMIAVDNVIYSTKSIAPYGTLKWDSTLYNDNNVAISCEVFFQKQEDKDFNDFNIYRYLDLMFKNIVGRVTVTIKEDTNSLRNTRSKSYYVGSSLEDELGALGETDVGEVLVADSYGQTVEASPFYKSRVSFLSKAQSLTIGLSNNVLNETFTVAEFALFGTKEPRKLFAPSGIVSIG